MTKAKNGIAVAGTTLLDQINEISAYPPAGELTQIRAVSRAVGGCVPNVGIDLRIMRPDLPVYALGCVGADANGDLIAAALRAHGLDIAGLRRLAGVETSFTQVMSIAGGERTFFTHAGASAAFGADDIDFDALDAKMLHLGYFLLLDRVDAGDGEKILSACRARGIKTSIDFVTENSDRYTSIRPCLPLVDNLIVNEIEACRLAGLTPARENVRRAAELLMAAGVRERVIIHMPDLGVILSAHGFSAVPTFENPPGFKKGTTGAGDAFCAGALIAIHEGWDDAELLNFASMAATMSISAPDATSGMKTEREIRDFCKTLRRLNVCL